MADHFTVTDEALIRASQAITLATELSGTEALTELPLSADQTGNADISTALTVLASSWQDGVSNLVGDGEQFADRLRQCASAYIGTDVQVAAEALAMERRVEEQ